MPQFLPFDRVIVLGLDSVCWDVLLPLALDKTMPALGAFLSKAHWGVLESTVPPHTAAAWTTFLTGKDPGRHGVIDFVGFDPARHRFRFHDSSTHRADNLLTRLSSAGVTCGSIFLPRNYPPYPLERGYMVSGFETPGINVRFTEPDALREEILALSPQLHFNFDDDWQPDGGDDKLFARNIERAMDAVDLLERLAVHFQRDRPTHLQIAYLQATDILFHKAWKWCAADGALASEARREQIKKFFRRVDLLINRVFGLHSSSTSQRLRPNGGLRTLRLICSDHGHGSSKGRVFINNFLRDWGFLSPLGHFRRATRRLSLLALDAAGRRERNRELPLDWSSTKAYLAHVGIYGFVYLNLRGREAQGIVAPEEFDAVRNALIERFKAEKVPGTNAPLFPAVLKGEEIYARKQELNLPDLVVVPADGFYPRKKLSRGPAVRVKLNAIGGIHRADGVYAFDGPGVKPSAGAGARANIADLAPTLLAALGQPVPASMTGKPMLHLFEIPPAVKTVSDAPSASAPPAEQAYSKDEEREIERRLSDLGYLE